MNYVYLGFLWVGYYLVHSLLATNRLKKFIEIRLPSIFPYYRVLYSAFATLSFLLLLLFQLRVPSEYLFIPPIYFWLPAFLLIGLGLLVTILSVKGYGMDFFFREKQLPAQEHKLLTSGTNAFVRHPLYFGLILILIGLMLYAPNWKNLIFTIVSTCYAFVGAKIEERKLIVLYGDAYRAYIKNVRMLIPYLF